MDGKMLYLAMKDLPNLRDFIFKGRIRIKMEIPENVRKEIRHLRDNVLIKEEIHGTRY